MLDQTHKPRLTYKEVQQLMANDLEKTEDGGVPDWMKRKSSGASFGNIDPSDLKPPQLKLLAGQSPQIMDGIPGAEVGKFWMTILNINLGPMVTGTPILLRKTYQLWAPKMPGNEQKGPLATASDGVNWDVPNQTFEVRFPAAQGGGTYTWRIGKRVEEYKMNKFGSSQPDNPKSKPAATLTYDVLWVIDLPNGQQQLCVFTNARTGITPTQNFISTIRAMGVDQYFQRYRIVAEKRTGPTGDPYFSYSYQYIGRLSSEAKGDEMQALYKQYSKSGFIADFAEEADEVRPQQRAADDGLEDLPF